jgi:streptogramin lyase
MRILRFSLPLAAAVVLAAVAGLAGRAEAIEITEFPLPVPNSSPLGIAVGSDGNLWFTEVAGSRFGRVTPAGAVTDFSTGSGISTNSQPWSIAPGPDGNVWFAEVNRVGRIFPSLATATEFSVGISPGAGIRGVAGGPDGNVWFTEDGGNRIGRITPAGTVTEFSAGISAGSRPQAIVAGPDGNLWFTEMDGNRIGRITPAGTVTEFPGGITPNSRPSGITAGPDGNLWFTELAGNRIGRSTTIGGVTEFPAGTAPNSGFRDIAPGPDGNLWFTDEQLGRIGRITTSGTVTMYPLSLAAGGIPLEITTAPDRHLWFTTGSGNHIARARLDPAVTTGPASSVTTTGAHLSGTVDPFGSATSYAFEYGPSTGYGSLTTSQILPSAPAALSVSVNVGGLASGTRYHYRLVASSVGGTSRGADSTFTTGGAPGQIPAGPGADRTGPRMRILNRALVLTSSGLVRLSLRCPLAETLGCRGRVRLATVARLAAGRQPLRLGSAAFRIGGGQTRTVTIRVSSRGRTLVRNHRGAVRVAAIVTASDAVGNRTTTARRLPLRSGS